MSGIQQTQGEGEGDGGRGREGEEEGRREGEDLPYPAPPLTSSFSHSYDDMFGIQRTQGLSQSVDIGSTHRLLLLSYGTDIRLEFENRNYYK